MSGNGTTTTETPTIAGLPATIFILIVAIASACVLICGAIPYIYCKRYFHRRKKINALREEREASGKGRSFFNRFTARFQRSGSEWVTRMDPETGHPYYENTITGEVSWTDPKANSAYVEPMPYGGAQVGMWNQQPQQQLQGSGRGMMPQQMMNGGGYQAAPRGYPPQQQPPMQGQYPPGRGPPPQQQQMMQPRPNMQPPQQMQGYPPQQQMPNYPPQQVQQPQQQQQQPQQQQAPPAPAAAPAPAAPAPAAAAAGGKSDPKYAKYLRMEKAGLPEGAIRNAMTRDGVDPEPFFKG